MGSFSVCDISCAQVDRLLCLKTLPATVIYKYNHPQKGTMLIRWQSLIYAQLRPWWIPSRNFAVLAPTSLCSKTKRCWRADWIKSDDYNICLWLARHSTGRMYRTEVAFAPHVIVTPVPDFSNFTKLLAVGWVVFLPAYTSFICAALTQQWLRDIYVRLASLFQKNPPSHPRRRAVALNENNLHNTHK